METSTGPTTALDEAVTRCVARGWRLVRRRRRSAELSDATGGNRLFLELDAGGRLREWQRTGSLRPAAQPARGIPVRALRRAFDLRAAVLAALVAFCLMLGLDIGWSLQDRGDAAAGTSLTAANVQHTLAQQPETLPGAGLHGARVDVSGAAVIIAVQPPVRSGADVLTLASLDALSAARAIFPAYPDARAVTLSLFGPAGVTPGQQPPQLLALITLTAPTAARLDYADLQARIFADQTRLLCEADSYRLSPLVYQELSAQVADSGCLRGPAR